jgi:hypothetical protein
MAVKPNAQRRLCVGNAKNTGSIGKWLKHEFGYRTYWMSRFSLVRRRDVVLLLVYNNGTTCNGAEFRRQYGLVLTVEIIDHQRLDGSSYCFISALRPRGNG